MPPALRHLLLALLFSVLAPGLCHADAVTHVVYPASETPNDPRFADLIEIMHMALEKTRATHGPYEVGPSSSRMTEPRYMLELEQHGEINIAWSSTSEDLEQRLLPLRIPLRKGLLGYRIAFIDKKNQDKIDRVKTLDDLKKLGIGQGIGWGDVALYEANGIKVSKARYPLLFKMVTSDRFDLFPRGIGEIFAEYEQFGKDNPDLAIEKNLLIYYPWPYYFFFNHKDQALKERIEQGVQIMLKDGSFDAIFWKYNQAAIEKAHLKGRRILRIKNHLLPKNTPLNNPALWYDPTQ